MQVERYEPLKHRASFRDWLDWHDQRPMTPEFLPEVGFVVPGLAMGFLYRTDSKVAQIEALVSNPMASAAERGAAIDAVAEAIANEARAQGFKALIGYTAIPAVVQRARQHGYVVGTDAYTLITKML